MSFEEENNNIDDTTVSNVIEKESNTDNGEKESSDDDWLTANGDPYVVVPTKSQIRMAKATDTVEKTVKGVNIVRKSITIILNVVQPLCLIATLLCGFSTLAVGFVSMLTFGQEFGDKVQSSFALTLALIGVDIILVIVRFICSSFKTNIFNIINITILFFLFQCKGNILIDFIKLALIILIIYYNVAPESWKKRRNKK